MGKYIDRLREINEGIIDGNERFKNLKGLSDEELGAVIPDTVDSEIYSQLIKIVEEAKQQNLKVAEFVERVKKLGEVAVNMAKKMIPALASFF